MTTAIDDGVDNTTAALSQAWHAVATSTEVTSMPVQVWLLGLAWRSVMARLVATAPIEEP